MQNQYMVCSVCTDRERSRLLLCAPHGSSSTQQIRQYESCSVAPHWHLPSPPITPNKPPSASQPVSISAILLGLTPLHRRHHNHIILLAHTRLANQPRGRVNDRVQVVNKKCKGSKVGQKEKCKSTPVSDSSAIRVHLTLHLAQSSISTGEQTCQFKINVKNQLL